MIDKALYNRINNWYNPTILEHLLNNAFKTKHLNKVLTALKLRIKACNGGNWFDIVKA